MPLKKTTEEYINQAKKVHGEKFDYSLVKYERSFDKVTIICRKHGEFRQEAKSHLNTSICCPICVKELGVNLKRTTDQFIEESKRVHGETYIYAKVNYKSAKEKVTIICRKHGEFQQRPRCHMKGSGCIICANERLLTGNNERRYFKPLLNMLGLKIKPQFPLRINGSVYFVDFYIERLNVVIEYDEKRHRYKTKKKKDKKRDKLIKQKLGCKIIRIDDEKFMSNNDETIRYILNIINNEPK